MQSESHLMSEAIHLSNVRWSSASYYSELAQTHLSEMENAIGREATLTRDGNITEEELYAVMVELHDVSDTVHAAAISAIVFAAMAIEAYIYDYAARHLGKPFTDKHVDTLSIESKWVVIPKLITGKSFPKDRRAFELLKGLIKSRNSLVHSKSRNVDVNDLSAEKTEARENELLENAKDSVLAIHLLAEEIESIHPDEMAKFHLGVHANLE